MNEITCIDCKAKSMSLVTGRYCAEVRHDGRPYTIDIPVLRYYRCKHCGSIVVPDESDEIIGIELRRVANLLPPHRIKQIREKFNLTQKEFAERLDVGEATICRWEKGTQIQQRAFDKILRAYEKVPGLHEFMGGESALPPAKPAANQVNVSQLVVVMLCQSTSIEPNTNRISFLHAVEGIQASDGPASAAIASNAAHFTPPHLTTAWLREPGDSTEDVFETDIMCRTPSGVPVFMSPPQQFSFGENINLHRFMAANIPFGGTPEHGVHVVEARIRKVGEQEWSAKQQYAFHVAVVPGSNQE